MSHEIHVDLRLSADTPDSMRFEDTYEGLDNVWYRFSADKDGNVDLFATADGYEHLARYFLKFARGGKSPGYHDHHPLEFGTDQDAAGRELTIGIVRSPEDVA